MVELNRSWQVTGPLSGRVVVTDEDGRPRLRRSGHAAARDTRTGLETANARLILHRTAVFETTAVPPAYREQFTDLDDAPVRTWAVDTDLGQAQTSDLRRAVIGRRHAALAVLAEVTGMQVVTIEFEPEGALITGTGAGGIRDVGIELHGTYGWPVLTASTIKGVAHAYARDVRAMPSTALEHFFGAPRPGVPGTAAQGSVMFYDALPGADGVTIAEHVLTPHARDYHTGHGTQDQRPPPAEYLNPVPIPFLAIEKGTFVVHLLALQADTNEVADLVTAAVGDIGVGAKTAAGYGYLIAAPSGIRQRSAQQQEQSR